MANTKSIISEYCETENNSRDNENENFSLLSLARFGDNFFFFLRVLHELLR